MKSYKRILIVAPIVLCLNAAARGQNQENNVIQFRTFSLSSEVKDPFSELKQWNNGVESLQDGEIVLLGEVQLPNHEIIYSQNGHTYLVPKTMTDVLQNDSIMLCHKSCYLFQIVSPLASNFNGKDKHRFPTLTQSLIAEQCIREKVIGKSKKDPIRSILNLKSSPRAYFLYAIRKKSYNWNCNFVHSDLQRRWKSYPIEIGNDDDFVRVDCPIL